MKAEQGTREWKAHTTLSFIPFRLLLLLVIDSSFVIKFNILENENSLSTE